MFSGMSSWMEGIVHVNVGSGVLDMLGQIMTLQDDYSVHFESREVLTMVLRGNVVLFTVAVL